MPRFAFEDFPPGRVLEYGAWHVTKDEILAFAHEFDPQPCHIDEEKAKHTLLGGLSTSGWHTAAMLFRMTCDAWLLDSTAMGSPGIEEIKWLKPVQEGDDLRAQAEVREARVSKSRPEMGLVFFEKQVINQAGETAMMQRSVGMFGRREKTAAPVVAPVAPPHASAPSVPRTAMADQSGPFGWFESVVLGATLDLGQYLFRRDDMLRFAQTFDPQPFHLDDAAAKAGPFGALCASGWYTAAAFMQRLVATRQRLRDEAVARGENPPEYGPSPGMRDLGWLRPVYVGDTLTFTTTPTSKRLTSRPGWGLVMSRCEGTNQNGVKAFEYTAVELLPARS